MGNVRFIGCLHLGHTWMAKHRGFKSVDDYHKTLVENWNKTVKKKDLVYILGDITMETSAHYHILDKLNGRKKVILGNHDKGKDIPELLKYVETVEGAVHYKGFWLTHIPIHPQDLSITLGNIHAHVHENDCEIVSTKVDYWDRKGTVTAEQGNGYYNVDAQKVGYAPKTLLELGLSSIDGFKPKHFKRQE